MTTVISFCSEKGGVGKTTLTSNLAAFLGRDHKVLCVDNDPQSNLTMSFGREPGERTLGDLFLGPDGRHADVASLILEGVAEGVDLVPARRPRMLEAEAALVVKDGNHAFLREILAPVRNRYDYVLIDAQASLGKLTMNAVCASDYVIGVWNAELWSVNGVAALTAFVDMARDRGLSQATLLGLVQNKRQQRLTLTQDVEQVMAGTDLPVFTTSIPHAVRVAEAAAEYQPVLIVDPDHPASRAMESFGDEVLVALKSREVA